MGGTLRISNKTGYQEVNKRINEWNIAINNVKDKINSICTDNINGYNAINLGSWNDQIAQNLNTYCGQVKAGLETLQSDINSGNFRSLSDALVDLSSKLASCQNIQNAIDSYTTQFNNATTDSLRAKLRAKLDTNYSRLYAAIDECNSILNVFPSIDFQSNYSFVSNGTNIEPDLGEVVDDPPEEGGNSGGSVADDFDYEALRDSMGDLFQWGVFKTAISYNGHTIYLMDTSNGSGKSFGFCDGYGNPIPNTPTFTKDQVAYMNHVQSDGTAVYPEVEAAAVEYFSKHQ